jgi:Uma2 family endonuclease
MSVALSPRGTIIYPDSDGKPMSDNTKQSRWIVTLFDNLLALFRKSADVFVAADLLWYPVEGEPETRAAPDVMVAFGRPKGDRGSYKQWEENDVPVTIAFEILSPQNSYFEMADKLDFYDRYGVEEYYVYDPDSNKLVVYIRQTASLIRDYAVDGFVSPRLGIRIQLDEPEMTIYRPDGRPFLTFEELEEVRLAAVERVDTAEKKAADAENIVTVLRQHLARIVELSRKARASQASAEELQELDRLEQQATPPT